MAATLAAFSASQIWLSPPAEQFEPKFWEMRAEADAIQATDSVPYDRYTTTGDALGVVPNGAERLLALSTSGPTTSASLAAAAAAATPSGPAAPATPPPSGVAYDPLEVARVLENADPAVGAFWMAHGTLNRASGSAAPSSRLCWWSCRCRSEVVD